MSFQSRPVAPLRTALAGKNLGLLCDDPSTDEALLACRAAADLGARVSLVRPRLTGEQERRALPETAHMLGRLYDVIACVALPADLVAALRGAAGVPVVGDLDVDAALPAAADRLHQWERLLAASVG